MEVKERGPWVKREKVIGWDAQGQELGFLG